MRQLIVLVEEIGSRGLEVERELAEPFLAEVLSGDGPATGFSPAGPARLAARFEKVSGKVLLTGSAAVSLTGSCKRCLVPVGVEVPLEFHVSLVRRLAEVEPVEESGSRREEEGSDASFDPGSADEELFDGREVDLGRLFREQLLLALPMDALCRDACPGLCPVCGRNLNEESCSCERKPPDPRWAALRDIKLP